MFSSRKRASTLIEVMLAAGLLSLLLLMHLLIFQSGMSSWHKVETQGSLLQQLQVAGGRWSRDCVQSSGTCVDMASDAMALLSPLSQTQGAACDPATGQVIWRRTVVFYLASAEFRVRNLDWGAASPNGKTIDQLNFGSGYKPLSFYRTGGHVLARFMELAEFSRQGSCWQLRLKASQKRYGREQPETVEVRFLALPRNL